MPKRKLQDLDPEEAARRNAQNRQHQKDFRERKKDMFRQLEEKVEQLQEELRISKEKLAAASVPASTSTLPSSPYYGSVSLQSVTFYGAACSSASPVTSGGAEVAKKAEKALADELRHRVAELVQENSTLKILAGQHNNFELQAAQALKAAESMRPQKSIPVAISPTSPMNNNSSSDQIPMLFDRDFNDADDASWRELANFDSEDELSTHTTTTKIDSDKTDVFSFLDIDDLRGDLQQIPSLQGSSALINDFCNIMNVAYIFARLLFLILLV
ncbi:UNVERIFIED_CONTAM: hypothetical protein HDU68_001723 [Siphonaria sp. JEL0065]|nr:hypothetical protein HDU68_001723 [Siphonaria sp. JEL0065]